jgi:hypothetical protein
LLEAALVLYDKECSEGKVNGDNAFTKDVVFGLNKLSEMNAAFSDAFPRDSESLFDSLISRLAPYEESVAKALCISKDYFKK